MTPNRQIVTSQVLPAPKFRYSPVVRCGGFAFVSGMLGLDRDTGSLVEGGAFEQAARILLNFKALAAEQGWSLAQIAMARIYCVDFETHFPQANRAWEAVFADVPPPARTSIGVAGLPLGGLVEIEFQVAL